MEAFHLRSRDKLTESIQIGPFRPLIADHFAQPLMRDPAHDRGAETGENLSFIFASFAMRKLCAEVELLGKLDVPILIVGESGSGKGTVAKLFHQLSHRSANRFLTI